MGERPEVIAVLLRPMTAVAENGSTIGTWARLGIERLLIAR